MTTSPLNSACLPAGGGVEINVSEIGFGCASLMRLPTARARRELLAAALDVGVTHFDVARMYGLGAAEAELGKALKGRRGSITIATKFGERLSPIAERLAPFQGPARALLARSGSTRSAVRTRREVVVAPRRYDAITARRSLDKSLRELGTEYVDILFLHDPRPHDEIDGDELAQFLVTARTEGKIRAWGISIDSMAGLEVMGRLVEPGVLQVREDLMHPSPAHQTAIAFGGLRWLEPMCAFLRSDAEAQKRWADALDCDPLEGDRLAVLMLASLRARPNVGALLYSTTQPRRLGLVEQLEALSNESEEASILQACVERDRESILRMVVQ